jgi:hypothetical protein
MKITKQNFVNITELKKAVSLARIEAKAEAERDCGKGILMSRGAWIKTFDAKGELLQGECDTWEFTGKADQFTFLANMLRYDSKVARIAIEGGWNWAESFRDHEEGNHEPYASEWEITFGTMEIVADEPAVAAIVEAAYAEIAAMEAPHHSPQYAAALVAHNEAQRAYTKVCEDYRAGRIGDDEYLAARAAYTAATADFDYAFMIESECGDKAVTVGAA